MTDIPSHMYNAGVGVGRAEERAAAVAVLKAVANFIGGGTSFCWCARRPTWGDLNTATHQPECQAARNYIADAENAKPEGKP